MLACLQLLRMLVANLFRPRRQLEVENLFLRHQLNIALRGAPHRPRLRGSDRALLLLMTWLWPSLRWRPSAPDHVLGDRRLRDLKPKLEQFTMDAWRAPQWVLLAHPLDEFAQLTANSGPPWPTARFPAPIGPKPCSMPPQDRVRPNDAGQTDQAWPQPGHPHQQSPVTPTNPWTVRRAILS